MILSDHTILTHQPPLVQPMRPRSIVGTLTYGIGPSGYDVRIAETRWFFLGRRFRLASTVERFEMPRDVLAKVHDKSTWARRKLCVQNTVIEPGWRGHLTVELAYYGLWPIRVKAGSPIAQIVFHRLDRPSLRPYDGKYQDQPTGPQKAK